MKKSFTFVSLLGLFVLATMQIRTSNRMGTFIAGLMSNSADDRGLVSVSVIDRPKIHTFFHDLGAQQEYEVLQLWKDEWWKAGFDPIVLTLDDAKKNPFFEEAEKIMAPIHGGVAYDSLCFYRWLAMAQESDGGWMSDHDTFPVNFTPNDVTVLPRGGDFTVFHSHIPAFMAGSAEEWDRVSRLIVAEIPNISDAMVKSDMHALLELKNKGSQNNGIYFISPERNYVLTGFQYDEPRKVNCRSMRYGRVVHMSQSSMYSAVKAGLYPLEKVNDDPRGDKRRARAMKVFLDDWRNNCAISFVASMTPEYAAKKRQKLEYTSVKQNKYTAII